jgi:hypothetical protein
LLFFLLLYHQERIEQEWLEEERRAREKEEEVRPEALRVEKEAKDQQRLKKERLEQVGRRKEGRDQKGRRKEESQRKGDREGKGGTLPPLFSSAVSFHSLHAQGRRGGDMEFYTPFSGLKNKKEHLVVRAEGEAKRQGGTFDDRYFIHLEKARKENRISLEFAYAFHCFADVPNSINNSREYIVAITEKGIKKEWIVVHTHYDHTKGGCLTMGDEVDQYEERKAAGRIGVEFPRILDAVMALKKFVMDKDGCCSVGDFCARHENFRSLIEEMTPEILCRHFPSQLRYFPFHNVHSPELEAALAVHKHAVDNGGSFCVTRRFFDAFHKDRRISRNIKNTIRTTKLPNLCMGFRKLLRYTWDRNKKVGTVIANSDGALRAVLALRKFSMSGRPFDVHDFHTQNPQDSQVVLAIAKREASAGNAPVEFDVLFHEGLQVVCSKFQFLLFARNEITLAPSFVNHVNLRCMEQCKVDAYGKAINPRVFLPAVNGKYFTAKDDKFKAFGRKKSTRDTLMFDIWDNNQADKWTIQKPGEMSPQRLLPLLRWLEVQRFSMNCSIINTGEREEMAKWAKGVIDQGEVSMGSEKGVKNMAKLAYRTDGTESSDSACSTYIAFGRNVARVSEQDANESIFDEDNDGWAFGKDDGWSYIEGDDGSVFAEDNDRAASW